MFACEDVDNVPVSVVAESEVAPLREPDIVILVRDVIEPLIASVVSVPVDVIFG